VVEATATAGSTPGAALTRFIRRHAAWTADSIGKSLTETTAEPTAFAAVDGFWSVWSRVQPPPEIRRSALLAEQATAVAKLLEDPRAERDAGAAGVIGRLADLLGRPLEQQRRATAVGASKDELDAADAALGAVRDWLADEAQIVAVCTELGEPDVQRWPAEDRAARLEAAAKRLNGLHPGRAHARLDHARLVWAGLHLQEVEGLLRRSDVTPPAAVDADALSALAQFTRVAMVFCDQWFALGLVGSDGVPLATRFERDVGDMTDRLVEPERAVALAEAIRREDRPVTDLLSLANKLAERPELRDAGAAIKVWNENEVAWRQWEASLRAVDSLSTLALTEMVPSIRDKRTFLGTHREPSWRKVVEACFDRHAADVEAQVTVECAAPLGGDGSDDEARSRRERIAAFDPTWAESVCAERASEMRAGWDAKFRSAALELAKRDVVAIDEIPELDRIERRFGELVGFISSYDSRRDTETEGAGFLDLLRFRREWLRDVEPAPWTKLLSDRTPPDGTASFEPQLRRFEEHLQVANERWPDRMRSRTTELIRRLRKEIADEARKTRGYDTTPDRYAHGRTLDQLDAHESALRRCQRAIEVVDRVADAAGVKATGERDEFRGERDALKDSLAYLGREQEFRRLQKRVEAISAATSLEQVLSLSQEFEGLLDPARSSVGSTPPTRSLGADRLARERDALVARLRNVAEQRAMAFADAASVAEAERVQTAIRNLRGLTEIAAAPVDPSPLDAMGSGPGLRYLGRNAQGGQEFVNDRSGIVFVLVPASPSGAAPPGDAFLIAKYEVTNEIFLQESKDLPDADRIKSEDEDLPVCVTWQSAVAFCDRCGFALPTEQQWRRAYSPSAAPRDPTRDENRMEPRRRPIRKDPTLNELGLCDFVGNVAEWLYGAALPGDPRDFVEHYSIDGLPIGDAGARSSGDAHGPPARRQLVKDDPLDTPTIGFRPVVNLPLRREP
jgi:hypothetical protein